MKKEELDSTRRMVQMMEESTTQGAKAAQSMSDQREQLDRVEGTVAIPIPREHSHFPSVKTVFL